MKIFIFLTSFFFIAKAVTAQFEKIYKSEDVIIGINFQTHKEIKAKQFSFNYFIEDFQPDSTLSNAVMVLK